MNNYSPPLARIGDKFALVVSRTKGVTKAPNINYRDFLRYAEATPNKTGYVPETFAWRGRNRPATFNCSMAFATEDRDFVPFLPALLDGSASILTTNIHGAARRRSLLWGQRILSSSAQLVFSGPQPKSLSWADFTRHSIAELSKYDQVERAVLPTAQLRLLNSLEAYPDYRAERGDSNTRNLDGDQKEPPGRIQLNKTLSLKKLFDGLVFAPPEPPKIAPSGSRIDERAIFAACFLVGGSTDQSRPDQWRDEWLARPVLLPPTPHVTPPNSEDKSETPSEPAPMLQAAAQNALDVGIVVERPTYSLDGEAIARFSRAFEHFSVHLAQLQHLRRFVNNWWDPLLNPPRWEEKRIAASNFLRDWQQHALNIDPLWALGSNDTLVDPTIISSLDLAVGLSSSWKIENRRLSALMQLCTQVLGDGDPSIHLNSMARDNG